MAFSFAGLAGYAKRAGNFAYKHQTLTRAAVGAAFGGMTGGFEGSLVGAGLGAGVGSKMLRTRGNRYGVKLGGFLSGNRAIGKRVGLQLGGSALPGAVMGTVGGLGVAGISSVFGGSSRPSHGNSFGSMQRGGYGLSSPMQRGGFGLTG